MRLTGASSAKGQQAMCGPQLGLPSRAFVKSATGRSAHRRAPGRGKLLCRADVNWDAFRSTVELGWQQPLHLPKTLGASNSSNVKQFDFLVIGSGIAGLSYALKVAQYGSVAVITKDYANEGCTQYAQGGVCAVLDKTDSVQDHIRDTIIAGAHLNDPMAVDVVCREGPARVLELVSLGAQFTRNKDGSLHLTKEGGHSNRRIVHAADLTGAEIERALLATARAHQNITFFEHHLAVDLVTDEYAGVEHCFGADVLDQRSMTMSRFIGLSTMLACGGAGQVYPNTTNPHVATGDGIAMAFRAGAHVSNMEFIQFHPTALYNPCPAPGERTFLITEAVRGEGGHLLNLSGERFMPKYDERLELAPRDIVARSIQDQMLSRNEPHVLLDISHKPKDTVLHHFPNIAAKCAERGIDITKDPIPVLPAQHYTCGGVQTGLLGETAVQGLFACGEVACTGLHGANRLASNSLLEGLVFADRAVNPSVAHADHSMRHCGRQLHYAAASADFNGARGPRKPSPAIQQWAAGARRELRDMMWRNCGIVRRAPELQKAAQHASALLAEARSALKTYGVSTELVELVNLATSAELVAQCCLQRRESRGGHFVLDYPNEVERERRPSMVVRPGSEREQSPQRVGKARPRAASPSRGPRLHQPGVLGPLHGGVINVDVGVNSSGKKSKASQRDMAVRSLPEDVA